MISTVLRTESLAINKMDKELLLMELTFFYSRVPGYNPSAIQNADTG